MTVALPPPPDHPRRLAYLGSPELAVAPLRALVNAGFEVPLVVSRADRRRGRGGTVTPSPVKAAALELGLAVTDDVDQLLHVPVDLAVVVAYGRLIKPHLLANLPFVNLHFSLLPRWRGAAPLERAILAGDERTGVCVMALEEGLDTGGVYRRREVPLQAETTLDELRVTLVDAGIALLIDCLRNGFGTAEPQQGEATYAAKLDPAELQLDWHQPAAQLIRVVRIGRAWTTFRGKRLLVLGGTASSEDLEAPPGTVAVVDGAVCVATGDGSLRLHDVQPEGKGRQSAAAWRNGARPQPGERFLAAPATT